MSSQLPSPEEQTSAIRERLAAPSTYQSAWQWNEDDTAKLMSAEDWLDEEADVDASLRGSGPDPDPGPDRGGIMRAIAKEIRQIRAERTQWAEASTHLVAQVDALTQDNAALKTLLASSMDSVDVLTAKAGQQGKMLTMVEASEAARMEHIRELQARVDELRELLGDVVR